MVDYHIKICRASFVYAGCSICLKSWCFSSHYFHEKRRNTAYKERVGEDCWTVMHKSGSACMLLNPFLVWNKLAINLPGIFRLKTHFSSAACRVTFKFERNLLSCRKTKQYGITAAGGEAAFKNTVHGLKIALCNLHKSAFCRVYHSSNINQDWIPLVWGTSINCERRDIPCLNEGQKAGRNPGI